MTKHAFSEAALLAAIRTAGNQAGVRLVRNTCGFDAERRIRYGLGSGSPDLVGIILDGTARAVAIEVKSATGRISREQAAWWAWARRHGIAGGVARSVEEALALVKEWTR